MFFCVVLEIPSARVLEICLKRQLACIRWFSFREFRIKVLCQKAYLPFNESLLRTFKFRYFPLGMTSSSSQNEHLKTQLLLFLSSTSKNKNEEHKEQLMLQQFPKMAGKFSPFSSRADALMRNNLMQMHLKTT